MTKLWRIHRAKKDKSIATRRLAGMFYSVRKVNSRTGIGIKTVDEIVTVGSVRPLDLDIEGEVLREVLPKRMRIVERSTRTSRWFRSPSREPHFGRRSIEQRHGSFAIRLPTRSLCSLDTPLSRSRLSIHLDTSRSSPPRRTNCFVHVRPSRRVDRRRRGNKA